MTAARGKWIFSQRSVTLEYQSKASPMPSMWLSSTNKMPMPCLLLCFYSLIFFGGGVRKDVLVLFHSLSLPFSLSLCCIIFTLNDGLIIFYVSFFFWWERKEEEKKEWSGVCKKWEGSWNSWEILIWCFSLNYLKRNL